MYLPNILNSRGFFQRCATWIDDRDYSEDLTDLLSRATSAIISTHRIQELRARCVREFELFDDQIGDCRDQIVFNSSSLVELKNEISPLLSSLRIMQDLTNGLVRRKTKAGIPRSISDTCKKLNKYPLPEELKRIYASYWSCGGSQIREYRVLDQHYIGITDHCFLQVSPSKKVVLLFPDDPSARAKRDLTYDKQICGISMLRVGFDALHEFIECIAEFFGYAPSTLHQVLSLQQLGDLRPFSKRTLALLYESPINRTPEGTLQMNISGLRIGQLPDGRLQFQNMNLTEAKLKALKDNQPMQTDGASPRR